MFDFHTIKHGDYTLWGCGMNIKGEEDRDVRFQGLTKWKLGENGQKKGAIRKWAPQLITA